MRIRLREPWLNPQDYLGDRERFLEAPLDDGVLYFESAIEIDEPLRESEGESRTALSA